MYRTLGYICNPHLFQRVDIRNYWDSVNTYPVDVGHTFSNVEPRVRLGIASVNFEQSGVFVLITESSAETCEHSPGVQTSVGPLLAPLLFDYFLLLVGRLDDFFGFDLCGRFTGFFRGRLGHLQHTTNTVANFLSNSIRRLGDRFLKILGPAAIAADH